MKYNENDAEKVISDEDIYQFIFDDKARKENAQIARSMNKSNSNMGQRGLKVASQNTRRSSSRNTGSISSRLGRIDRPDRLRHNTKRSKKASVLSALGTIIYFPLLIIYLEIFFHLFMEGEVSKYAILYTLFSIPVGIVVGIITMLFSEKVNRIISYVLSFVLFLVYGAEMVLRDIFAMYTPLFSIMDTAGQVAEANYIKVAIDSIIKNFWYVVVLILPVVLMWVFGKKVIDFRRKDIKVPVIFAGVAAVIHLLALGCMKLPWELSHGAYHPKELYKMDSFIDEQVNKLGVFTMIRLDLKHSLFGTDGAVTGDSGVTIPTLPPVNKPTTSDKNNEEGTTEEPTTEKPIDRSPNILDIDFESLIAKEKNADIKWLHKFFGQQNADGTYTWATNKNEYTGMFKDYNLIFITAEGFSKYALDPELFPTLYKISNEGFVFNNYYTALHYTSTSGGECQHLTGMYPKNGGKITMQQIGNEKTNVYFSLARQLSRAGYKTLAWHNNTEMYNRYKSHTAIGYDYKQGGDGYEMDTYANGKKIWPQSDYNMMVKTIGDYINSEDPFHIYYLTVSGHLQYNFAGGNAMCTQNKSYVEHLDYSDKTKAYIACQIELERAVTYLIDELTKAGKMDKTLLVISPDHIPYNDIDICEELAGVQFGGAELGSYLRESDLNFDLYRNMLVMWTPSMEEKVVVDKVCHQVDILPTISNLMGLPYDSRLLVGSDILSDSQGLVIFSSNCWKTDIGFYSVFTGKFTLNPDLDPNVYTKEWIDSYVKAMKKVVSNKRVASQIFVDEDYYSSIFPR